MKIVLDSNIFVSLFTNDQHHQAARNLLSEVMEGRKQGVIAALSIVEICGALARRVGPDSSQSAYSYLQELISFNILIVEHLTERRVHAATNFAIQQKLKGADAIISSLAYELDSPLITFDKELAEKVKGKVKSG